MHAGRNLQVTKNIFEKMLHKNDTLFNFCRDKRKSEKCVTISAMSRSFCPAGINDRSTKVLGL